VDWLGEQIAFDMLGPGDFFAVYVMNSDGQESRCVTCGHPDLPGRKGGRWQLLQLLPHPPPPGGRGLAPHRGRVHRLV